jgi:hypothetical protein
MLVGYVRVSTEGDGQVLNLQRDALLSAGVDERPLFEDRASGSRGDRVGQANAFASYAPATVGISGSGTGLAYRCLTSSPPFKRAISSRSSLIISFRTEMSSNCLTSSALSRSYPVPKT